MANNTTNSTITTFTIRSARPSDLPALIDTGYSAFTTFDAFGPPFYDDAAVLPALIASTHRFRWDYWRVIEGQTPSGSDSLLAYALWSPWAMRLCGSRIRGLILAPLAVRAEYQKQGLGAQLMADGLALAQREGVNLISILGHESYYPRFGYQTGIFGKSGIRIPLPMAELGDHLSDSARLDEAVTIRPVQVGDVPALVTLGEQWLEDRQGTWVDESGLGPWLSCTRGVMAAVLVHHGTVIAYCRVDTRPQTIADSGILRFLAKDRQAADHLLSWARHQAGWQGDSAFLPLDFDCQPTREVFPEAQPVHQPWVAGMARCVHDCRLGDGSLLSERLAGIKAGRHPPLPVEYPPIFDF